MPAKRKIKKEQDKVAVKETQEKEVPPVTATQLSTRVPQNFIKKVPILIVIVLILLGLGFYFLRKWLVVAEVNGQPISRMDFTHLLEVQNGDQVLNELIAKTLILQEADRRHITVSQNEVSSRVQAFQKSLAKQSRTLDQYLTVNKKTMADFNDEVKLQIILEKLFSKDIQVTDKEVSDYIDQNKDNIPATINQNDLKIQVKQQLTNQKLQDKLPGFVQDLQKKAKIQKLITY